MAKPQTSRDDPHGGGGGGGYGPRGAGPYGPPGGGYGRSPYGGPMGRGPPYGAHLMAARLVHMATLRCPAVAAFTHCAA